MSDWKYLQKDHSGTIARLHYFSVTKKHSSGEIETCITVKEFAAPKTQDMQFFAEADIELNQKSMKLKPFGWSDTLMGALGECLRNLRRFEYEAAEQVSAPPGD